MRVDPKQLILTLKENDDQVRRTARQLGVSPGTVINWKRKASTGSLAHRLRYSTRGLKRRSTTPKATQHGTTLSASDQDRIVALRRRRGQCAIKVTADLGLGCHPRTVHRFLKARSLTAPGTNY